MTTTIKPATWDDVQPYDIVTYRTVTRSGNWVTRRMEIHARSTHLIDDSRYLEGQCLTKAGKRHGSLNSSRWSRGGHGTYVDLHRIISVETTRETAPPVVEPAPVVEPEPEHTRPLTPGEIRTWEGNGWTVTAMHVDQGAFTTVQVRQGGTFSRQHSRTEVSEYRMLRHYAHVISLVTAA